MANVDRRERLRKLAMETIDISKDPYFMKNHLGSYECRLCLTIHTNEGSYLAHTQGKKHQTNLARRQAKEQGNQLLPQQVKKAEKKKMPKIGRPGYKLTKLKDPDTNQRSMLFEIDYPEVKDVIPRYRVMSCYEQKVNFYLFRSNNLMRNTNMLSSRLIRMIILLLKYLISKSTTQRISIYVTGTRRKKPTLFSYISEKEGLKTQLLCYHINPAVLIP
jgi:hypothetical protein